MTTPLTADAVLRAAPIIPTITIDHLEDAVPFARALVDGGLRVLEITLRTPAAMAAIAKIARDVPDAIVGAGTVLTPGHYAAVRDSGAVFAISPGSSPELLRANAAACPLIPGVATASELMQGMQAGFTHFKFFPAEASGGTSWLRAVQGPFAEARFCPTGGISAETAPNYLALSNVLTVGGSWMLPKDAIVARDWDRIRQLATQAAALHQKK
ncbi:bifunctional 4-hydroxy-2-oxoglutarate aldolase/2-dehydro-3-deoxy-phosphogluconate aldolase [Solilutibacter silvestris]|uniref:2-dehydro-3-deoxy-phosphogluconate aldolase n=1 Tax=Solilutibacter silvestris TaxID=1645665 RepID=A0A2K1PZ16_9GAMM|nr:bifunctional 4-hydroxy-2-oxoglutarate aldolase/2-dehydro-3-deoxy-phosphogluconate aldolase [Lysobacter silvestris]PNS08036.1 eda: 2-dehydro-3-deoxyphosphogluconate aldolase/4-hydroxy-2-oxoglutarate aldolase [Lysobacter silvestris]